MKFKMAEKSLFATLLRSPWWVSLAIAAVLALLAMSLLPPDYKVVGATSGFPFLVIAVIAAIDAVRLAPGGHDLVVTDFNMPGLSGLSVAEQLAEIAPGLPVIITSGYVTEELMERARGLGVRAVLLKEHSLERLARSVRESLAGAAADGDTPAGVSRA